LKLAEVRGFPAAAGRLDLHVGAGELILLEGRNGSGKTSLLRALAGLPAALCPAHVERAAHLRFGLSPQTARDGLVGLTVAGERRLQQGASRASHSRLGLDPHADVATLSPGQARRLHLDLIGAPPLLLLDEPAERLDAAGRDVVVALVASVIKAGGAVVAADHAGILAPLASRRVKLDDDAPYDARPVGQPHSDAALGDPASPPARLVADAFSIELGGACYRFPALRLGAGLHVVHGPNGSGKTTWLRHLAGVYGSDRARLDGAAVRAGHNTRTCLSEPTAALVAERVADLVADPAGWFAADLLERHPLRLSGGQARRVQLARTFAAPAPLFLLDEPEAHLDRAGRAHLLDVVSRATAAGSCVLAATHDPAWHERAVSRHTPDAPVVMA